MAKHYLVHGQVYSEESLRLAGWTDKTLKAPYAFKVNAKLRGTIHMTPEFTLKLNSMIVKLLHKKARNHYDRKCRGAIAAGGILFKWQRLIDNEFECSASFRDLDLTLKICEFYAGTTGFTEGEVKELSKYSAFIRKMLSNANRLAMDFKPLTVEQRNG